MTPSSTSPGPIKQAHPGESARGPQGDTSLGAPAPNPLIGACCVCHVIYRDGVAPVSHGFCVTHEATYRMGEKAVAEVSEEFTR